MQSTKRYFDIKVTKYNEPKKAVARWIEELR